MRDRLFTGSFLRLWAVSFVTFFAAFQLFPAIPFRILELGGSEAQGGWFLAAYTWASALAAPFAGALADRLGHRRVLLVAAASFLVFSLLYGLVRPLPLLLGIAALHGVFWSALLSASGALISDVIPASRRTEGLGYWGIAPTAAIAVAPAAGLALYRVGWSLLMVELAAVAAIVVLLAWKLPAETPRPATPPGPLLHWRALCTAGTIVPVALAYGGVTSYVALLAVERDIPPPSLFFTVFALTVLASRLTVVPLADRTGPVRLLVPSLLAVPPALWVLAGAGGHGAIVAAGVLFGLGLGGTYPALLSWLLHRAEPERRGALFGSVLFAMDTGIGTGSLLCGALVASGGYTLAFRTAAIVSLLALPVFLLARRLWQ